MPREKKTIDLVHAWGAHENCGDKLSAVLHASDSTGRKYRLKLEGETLQWFVNWSARIADARLKDMPLPTKEQTNQERIMRTVSASGPYLNPID